MTMDLTLTLYNSSPKEKHPSSYFASVYVEMFFKAVFPGNMKTHRVNVYAKHLLVENAVLKPYLVNQQENVSKIYRREFKPVNSSNKIAGNLLKVKDEYFVGEIWVHAFNTV